MFGYNKQRRERQRNAFLSAMSLVAATVCIVTTNGPNGRKGATISAMSSVSADGPRPMLLVCLHKDGSLGQDILRNGTFCVNVLHEGQSAISDVFAGRLGHTQPQRFDVAEWHPMADGCPGLVGSIARLSCRVAASKRIGTHDVIFGAVHEMQLAGDGQPLVYASRSYARPEPLDDPAPGLKVA